MYTKRMKNSFAKVSKNLAGYESENNFARNNSVECINIFDNVTKYFILTTSLNVLYNYFDSPNKIIF